MVVQVAVLRPSSAPFRLAAAAVEGLDVARLAAGCSCYGGIFSRLWTLADILASLLAGVVAD